MDQAVVEVAAALVGALTLFVTLFLFRLLVLAIEEVREFLRTRLSAERFYLVDEVLHQAVAAAHDARSSGKIGDSGLLALGYAVDVSQDALARLGIDVDRQLLEDGARAAYQRQRHTFEEWDDPPTDPGPDLSPGESGPG